MCELSCMVAYHALIGENETNTSKSNENMLCIDNILSDFSHSFFLVNLIFHIHITYFWRVEWGGLGALAHIDSSIYTVYVIFNLSPNDSLSGKKLGVIWCRKWVQSPSMHPLFPSPKCV